MVNHSALCRSIKYDYLNILIWTILKKTQILNGCKTFAFKYIYGKHIYIYKIRLIAKCAKAIIVLFPGSRDILSQMEARRRE